MHINTPKKNDNVMTIHVDSSRRMGHNTQKAQFFGHKTSKRLKTRQASNRRALSEY